MIEIIYCYVVCVNDGFYMEPDVKVYKVFLNYNDAISCVSMIKDKYRDGAFIEKRRLYL